jgi:hypothetical protein
MGSRCARLNKLRREFAGSNMSRLTRPPATNEDGTRPRGHTEIHTLSALLPGGSVLEAVRPDDSVGLKLLVQKGRSRTLVDKVVLDGVTYCPPELHSDWFSACRFARGARRVKPIADLFSDLVRLFTHTLGQTEETAAILVFFVLSTWFAEVLPLAPLLLLIDNGDYTVEVVRRCLQALCRRSLELADFSRATLLQLPAGLTGTLFLEQPGIAAQGLRLLHMTCRPGAHFISAGRPQPFAAAKVIRCGPDPGELSELVEGALIVQPAAAAPGPAANLDVEPIAAEFQPQLLAYRLANLLCVRHSGFVAGSLDCSLQELGRSLGMCLEGCSELQEKMLASLQGRDREVRGERSSQAPAVVLEALLAAIHVGASEVRVAQICLDANTIFKQRGERTVLEARKVGGILSGLGLATESLDRLGRGLRLSKALQQKAHELARAHATRTPLDRPGCEFCLPSSGRPQ